MEIAPEHAFASGEKKVTLSDAQVVALVRRMTGSMTAKEAERITLPILGELSYNLCREGASIRQLSRVLQMSKSAVERALKIHAENSANSEARRRQVCSANIFRPRFFRAISRRFGSIRNADCNPKRISSQYTPDFNVTGDNNLDRKVTSMEYRRVVAAAEKYGLKGYMQSPSSICNASAFS